ncbi:MAG TPA: galactose-1-phosphate uridylyltransferase [Candidatus Latescibacteria bacterium]|nr:galactose-1-phosphate uridylyltransferase [Candidatus Latescibacterota bacterium]
MSELRWNPLLREWVATATHRMDRPQLPEDWCPFCPGSGRVPDDYDVYIYPNDFPTFSIPPPEPDVAGSELFQVQSSVGVCDVVLYTPDHNSSLAQLPVDHIVKLIDLWRCRYEELGKIPNIKYVFEFENKGEVIGVTMPHPHGQIYAFPFIPPRIQTELDSARRYEREKGRCLFCEIIAAEIADGRRIIGRSDSFIAILPFYARFPYEIHIFSLRHLLSFSDFTADEVSDLAKVLKFVLAKYDNLYGFSFPYMMVIHQAPTDDEDHGYYHFHIEFYPPYRSRTKLKYLASCESGAGTFINDSCPEEKAKILQETQPHQINEVL